MSKWAVFITARSPQRWLQFFSSLPSTDQEATLLPLPDITDSNDFVSKSLAEINSFIRANEDALSAIDISSGNWLIIDQKGLETSTCLVCEQVYNSGEKNGGEGEPGLTSEFRACRLPYEEAWSMIANLDMNLGFEEFVDQDVGEQEDGTWKWSSFDPSTDDAEEKTESEVEREKALQELRDNGHAD
ncbi:hypothetical protein B0H13DRAFT_2088370 [Mycena leptocephala]|nr:hypothetical protein B0H13DRAFT_2088370 [Mycena leptocephala]